MTFEAWLKKVDAVFLARTGLDRDSFPDNCYWDMWDAGDTPAEAFESTMENEGYEGVF